MITELVDKLPVYDMVLSPFCLGCNCKEHKDGFVTPFSDVTFRDPSNGNYVDEMQIYFCVPCVKRLMEALPGTFTTKTKTENAHARVVAAEQALVRKRAELAGWERLGKMMGVLGEGEIVPAQARSRSHAVPAGVYHASVS